jgi:hypothetical protein
MPAQASKMVTKVFMYISSKSRDMRQK